MDKLYLFESFFDVAKDAVHMSNRIHDYATNLVKQLKFATDPKVPVALQREKPERESRGAYNARIREVRAEWPET